MTQIEPMMKVVAATALSNSLSFCLERKYLHNIGMGNLFTLEAVAPTAGSYASWIKINQVGKPLDDSAESCFTAIQKILYSCFMPKETQLLFLVVGRNGVTSLYVGIRTPDKATPSKSLVRNLNEFIKGIWPGVNTEILNYEDEEIQEIQQEMADADLDNVYSLTGIPSMESQYKDTYPATIDKLIAGMSRSKKFVYMVVADPVENQECEYMLHQCREMNGQAESLKSINITEGLTLGTSMSHTQGTTKSHSTSHTCSYSESVSKKDFSSMSKAAMVATGLGAVASIFPAAGAVLESTVSTAGEIATAALGFVGATQIGNIITNLMPQKTTTHGISDTASDSYSESKSYTEGTNESKSSSLSRNIVNKHIEAVGEHLFYHSKRYETGKAIGLWKVGVYLMADKSSDLQSGSLQLRSILSGQESIYEPIRIHNISSIMDEYIERNQSLRQLSLAQFQSPTINLCDIKGKIFNHPLGNGNCELKTILTTKELSYLINFPLHSVPGISVVDSSPEFSLNQQILKKSHSTIEFGKLLYGGSETSIPYYIVKETLSRHILLSGINGTGKTNTVQAILNGIDDIPFLVIEPAKTEYVDWAIEYNKKHINNPINIFVPGCKRYKGGVVPKPLRLNPFQLVWLDKEQEPNVLAHIDRLKSTFASAFPMYDILPVLMEDLIYTVYQNKSTNWLTETPILGKTHTPTLNSMSVSVNNVLSNRGYEQRVEQNMKACLNTRIDSLKRGWKGETLNTMISTPWEELFEKPCLINLSYVGDDVDKGFFMSLILQFLYEYRQVKAELGMVDFNSNKCHHLTVIEEAHRVMAKCDNPELPQYKSAMMFSNMLSEIRAYGEGMMLVDQVPTRLIPDAIKNTSLKITHRLVAEDDQKSIAESMGLSKEQRIIIPKLLTGQCVISNSLSTDVHWIKVNKVK